MHQATLPHTTISSTNMDSTISNQAGISQMQNSAHIRNYCLTAEQ